MSAAAFTPGPWRVEGPPDFPNPNMGMWQVEGRTNICTHCTLYDARLIAAAPDLYEALADLCSRQLLAVRDDPSAITLKEAVERGHAALAKATPPSGDTA